MAFLPQKSQVRFNLIIFYFSPEEKCSSLKSYKCVHFLCLGSLIWAAGFRCLTASFFILSLETSCSSYVCVCVCVCVCACVCVGANKFALNDSASPCLLSGVAGSLVGGQKAICFNIVHTHTHTHTHHWTMTPECFQTHLADVSTRAILNYCRLFTLFSSPLISFPSFHPKCPLLVSLSVRKVVPFISLSRGTSLITSFFKRVIHSLCSLSLSFCARRTATSRRRSTMRFGCATGPVSCWPPAPRKTRRWRRRRACRPVALASWRTCRSCRGWRRPRSCRRSRGGRRTRGRWTTDSHAKEKWPSQASRASLKTDVRVRTLWCRRLLQRLTSSSLSLSLLEDVSFSHGDLQTLPIVSRERAVIFMIMGRLCLCRRRTAER